MEDILAVYHRAYGPKRPQVCLDEIPKTLRSIPRRQLALQPGQPKRADYEYTRHGQCSLFLAVEPLRGYRRVWVHERRTKLDFSDVLKALVDEVYPDADRILLVVDNLNTHHAASLYERFSSLKARRIAANIEWYYTPEHASWLNIAECELSVLARQCLQAPLPDIHIVHQQVCAWQQQRNQARATIHWRFTTRMLGSSSDAFIL